VDLLNLGTLAPHFRISLESSRFITSAIFGLGIFGGAAISAAIAGLAWSRARGLTEEVWRRRGLRPGPILLCGVAERLEEAPTAVTDTAQPLIELEIEQIGTQHQSKSGSYVRWEETSRSLKERPFLIRTDNGDRVRVEPGGRIDLVDRLEAAQRGPGKVRRLRRARIEAGDRLWIRGELHRVGGGIDEGPYRGGGPTSAHVLRPPGRGALFVSSEPVEAQGLSDARFHGRYALLYVLLLALAQLVLFSDFRALHTHGVAGEASIVSRRSWTTRSKNRVTHHYAFTLRYLDEHGVEHQREEETNSRAYIFTRADAKVPITYLSTSPSTMQIGRAEEVGTTTGRIAIAAVLLSLLAIGHTMIGLSRRPWWRKKTLVETEQGVL